MYLEISQAEQYRPHQNVPSPVTSLGEMSWKCPEALQAYHKINEAQRVNSKRQNR